MSMLRRLGVGLLALLVILSTALFGVLPLSETATAAPTYTYETVDSEANPNLCPDARGEVLAIRETDTTGAGGSTITSYWCHVSSTTYEFAKTQGNNRISVAAASPQQGTLTSATQTSTIGIGNAALFSQTFRNATAQNPEDSSCESAGGKMGWIMCPLVTMMSGAINWLDERIQGILAIGEDRYTNDKLKSAWMNFRNIAYAILIPIMLIMVIGTALGFDIFSAYTVKKALPRMVLAIIFITLSWYITAFLIGFFNVIGSGILGLMTSPFGIDGNMSLSTLFGTSTSNVGDGASTLGSAVVQWSATLGSLAALGILISTGALPILLFYLVPVVAFVLGAFVVLMLRELFILAAILMAPVAILSWVFPGNDKLWKLWWNTFSKLLLMFPLIMLILGAGRIAAYLIDISEAGRAQSIVNPLLKLTAYLLPYVFIPFAFKFAGGIFANLAGIVNNKEKGLLDRARKSRGERWGEWNGRRKNGSLWRNVPEGSRRAKYNARAERWSNIGAAGFSLNRDKRRGRIQSHLATNNLTAAHQAMKENPELSVLLGNEDYGEAGRSGHGYVKDANGNYVIDARGAKIRRDGSERAIRAYLGSRGYSEEDIQSVWLARRSMSQDVFNIASVLSIPGTGTGFGDGAGQMDSAINETVGNNRRLAATMLAEMRGTAERAGRADLKGGGFGKRRDALEAQYRQELTLAEQLAQGIFDQTEYDRRLAAIQSGTTDSVSDMTLYSTESRGIAGMKPKQIKEKILPRLRLQLEGAYRSGNSQDISIQLAKAAAIYDQSQYASPEVQDIIANELMSLEISNRTINGRRATVREDIEEARSDKTFLERRREIGGGRTAAEIARMSEVERQAYLRDQQARRDAEQ